MMPCFYLKHQYHREVPQTTLKIKLKGVKKSEEEN
jgi:hypothetical protein